MDFAFPNKFFDIDFDIVPEKSVGNHLYRWIPWTVQSHFFSLWIMPWSILNIAIYCVLSSCPTKYITHLVFLYINCPWRIEKGLQTFQKLNFFTWSSSISDEKTFFGKYVSIASNITWSAILQNQNVQNVQTFENTIVFLWNNLISRRIHSGL